MTGEAGGHPTIFMMDFGPGGFRAPSGGHNQAWQAAPGIYKASGEGPYSGPSGQEELWEGGGAGHREHRPRRGPQRLTEADTEDPEGR